MNAKTKKEEAKKLAGLDDDRLRYELQSRKHWFNVTIQTYGKRDINLAQDDYNLAAAEARARGWNWRDM